MNDSEAIALARTGSADDARAWLEAAYVAHREPVFRYARAMAGDEDAALDLTATAFERAVAEARRGREVGLGWLLRTVRNAAIDADRRARTARLFRLRSAGPPPAAASAEAESLDAERARLVHAALARLPSAQRDAIALRYSTGLTVREVAGLVGRSQAATQKLIDRGLARLKEDLRDELG